MAIGTTAALLGSAVIGAGASIAGAGSNSKAINNASAQTAADSAASRALQQQIYDRNNALLSPFVQRGDAAGATINALLGLGGSAGIATSGGAPDYTRYVESNPDILAEYGRVAPLFGSEADYGRFHYGTYGQAEGRQVPGALGSSASTPDAASAFDTYKNSTGYQFRVGEGQKSMIALLAANGSFDSGSAIKSALNYGQGAASGEFGNFMGYLGNQQGVGLSGASAVAGVGQNYANGTTGINSQNSANAWNTAQAKASNTNSLYGNLASSFGTAAGALSGFGLTRKPVDYGIYGSQGEF